MSSSQNPNEAKAGTAYIVSRPVRLQGVSTEVPERGPYDVFDVTDDGEPVLYDEQGVGVFVDSETEWTEAVCTRCGRHYQHVMPFVGGGTCYGNDSDQACADAAEVGP